MQGKQAGGGGGGLKSEKEESCAILFPFPHFLPALFLGSFAIVQMQVKPSESQLAKSREPQAQSVLISSNFSFIFPPNPDKSYMFSAPFFGSRICWLIANYFIP